MNPARALRMGAANARMEAAGHVNDSPLFMAEYVLRFLWVAALLSVWRMVLAGRGTVSGMSMDSVLTYTLVSAVFAPQMGARTHIEFIMWDGQLATRMLRPMGLMFGLVMEQAGNWVVSFACCSLPLLLAAPWLGASVHPASAAAGVLFVPSLLLAIAVAFALDFLFAPLFVLTNTSVWAVDQVRSAIRLLLSGRMLPLALMPWGVGKVFEWLPFAAMASAPLRIYTGTGNPAQLMAIQAFWAIVLAIAANRLWRTNASRLASYGG